MRVGITIVGLVATCIGCGGVRHVGEYSPKTRTYKQPVEQPEEAKRDDNGSLFTDEGALLGAVQDVRALAVNDVVVVQIVEMAEARRSATTDVDKDGGLDFALGAGGKDGLHLGESAEIDMGLNSANHGSTERRDNVRFTVAATVKERFANGNLFVEGHRVVMVNDEEHHYYISGVARPADIDAGNTIRSDRLADAQVELTGRGIVSDAQEPGWLTKFFKWISLF